MRSKKKYITYYPENSPSYETAEQMDSGALTIRVRVLLGILIVADDSRMMRANHVRYIGTIRTYYVGFTKIRFDSQRSQH